MGVIFLQPGKISKIIHTINNDPEFKLAARFMTERMHLGAGDAECIFDIHEGVLKEIILEPSVEPWSFSFKGSEKAWETLLQPVPPPFHDSLWTNMQRGNLKLEGNIEVAYAYFQALVRIVEILRQLQNSK